MGPTMEPARSPRLAPYLSVRDAAGLAKFIEAGIGGDRGYEEIDDSGHVSHLELRIGDAVVMVSDTPVGRTPFPGMLHLYVPDADAAYRRALSAGAVSVREPTNGPDGRRGGVRDGWGNEWWFTCPDV
jgi:PhnB protein